MQCKWVTPFDALMNLAYAHQQKIGWYPEKLYFAKGSGDPKWLTRDYRGPWQV